MHGILNDTSLAAVSNSDRSKYVFFQDISEDLRQICYSSSTQSWSAGINLAIPYATPRNKTPLAATLQLESTDGSDEVKPFLLTLGSVGLLC